MRISDWSSDVCSSDLCVTRHGITAEQKGPYFDYSLARISREWLANDIAKLGLSPAVVDKALDFGPTGANPDLSTEMTEEQIMKIVQAYVETGIDIDKLDRKSTRLNSSH